MDLFYEMDKHDRAVDKSRKEEEERSRMKIHRVDHVGILCARSKESSSISAWRKLEVLPTFRGFVKAYSAYCQFLAVPGDDVEIELIVPSPESVLNKRLEERGSGLHHVALRVSGLEEMVHNMAVEGVEFVGGGIQEGARPQMKIAFIHPQETGGVLIELVEYGK